MGERVVVFARVQHGRDGLVGEELEGGEGDGHGEGRRVGDVEGAKTFVLVDVTGAVDHGSVHLARVLDLHALLDDYGWRGGWSESDSARGTNGFAREVSYHQRGS